MPDHTLQPYFVVEPQRGAAGRRELTRNNAARLRADVTDLVARGNTRVVVDCRHTNYIDPAGVGALVAARKLVHDAGGSLFLAGMSDDLLTLFRLTRLDTLFTPLPHDAVTTLAAFATAPACFLPEGAP